MSVLFGDNAKSVLASPILVGATALPVLTGDGAKFRQPVAADEYFYVTLQNGATSEVVRCPTRAGDSIGCAPTLNAYPAGTFVQMRECRAMFEDMMALSTSTSNGLMSRKDFLRLNRRAMFSAYKESGSTNVATVGLKPLALAGGVSSDNTDGPMLAFVTAATANDFKGIAETTFTEWMRAWQVRWGMRIQLGGNVAGIRLHFGAYSAEVQALSTLSATGVKGFGFFYDTGVHGTATWRTITSDGSAQTVKDTGLPVTISTTYDPFIDTSDTSKIDFYLGDTLASSHSSSENLPALSDRIGPANRVTALGASSRRFLLARWVGDRL